MENLRDLEIPQQGDRQSAAVKLSEACNNTNHLDKLTQQGNKTSGPAQAILEGFSLGGAAVAQGAAEALKALGLKEIVGAVGAASASGAAAIEVGIRQTIKALGADAGKGREQVGQPQSPPGMEVDFQKGAKQIRDGLQRQKFPEGEDGNLVLGISLSTYRDHHGDDFLKKFVQDSNEVLGKSPLKGTVAFGEPRPLDEATKTNLQKELQKGLASKNLKLIGADILDMQDGKGKCTDSRVIAVCETPDKQTIVTVLKIEK